MVCSFGGSLRESLLWLRRLVMRNDSQRNGDGEAMVPRPGRVNNGIIPNSFKTLSSYLKIVSSGASTVASTVRSAASAASAIVERDGETNHDQVRLQKIIYFLYSPLIWIISC